MRYRVTFVAGFAAGYVLGARAGRERYEQVKKLSQRAAGNPAVQKAAGTVSAKAAELGKTAKDKATDKMPGFAQTAMSKAGYDPGPARPGERVGGLRQRRGGPLQPASGDGDRGDRNLPRRHLRPTGSHSARWPHERLPGG